MRPLGPALLCIFYDQSSLLVENMVKGLENDEIEFLETVSRQREQEELEKDLEERILLAEYKVCS